METVVSYETILVEQRDAVTLITLNRPQSLNALNSGVLEELIAAFAAFEADPGQRCAVLTGAGEKAFAAGADIKEMADKSAAEFYAGDFFSRWTSHLVKTTRKPWIAAVNGFALGGGCELAMMADFIIASENARFGQPEIKLGVAPGMGGSQRLTRAIGKAKSMEMCLTGPDDGRRGGRAFGSGRAGRAARFAGGRGDQDRDRDRRNAAARNYRQQGNGQRRVRDRARPRDRDRTPDLPGADRDRGQGRGHGRVHRKAGRGMDGEVT